MKKFLTLCATFTLVGALFVGCIDNKEPEGVLIVRKSIAALNEAKALLVNAQADYWKADAEFQRAKSRFVDEKTAILKQVEEAKKIQNEFDRKVLEARIAAQIAEYNAQAQREMAALYRAKAATERAERQYIKELIQTQEELRQKKNTALDNVTKEITNLIIRQADVRNQILAWQARYFFYETVEIPYIQRRLEYNVEASALYLEYCTFMYNLWSEIKNLAMSEYKKYADEMYPKMLELEQKEVTLRANLENERFNLTELEKVEAAAKYAYMFSGVNTPLTTVSVPNVFSTTASDWFKTDILTVGKIEQGTEEYNPAAPVYKYVLGGVYKNTYSLYWQPGTESYQEGTIASLGYKNTLERLQADYNLIKEGRIYGLESKYRVAKELSNRESAMDEAIEDFEDACEVWKDSYTKVKNGPTWGTKRSDFITAYNTYNNNIGYDAALYIAAVWNLLLSEPANTTTDGKAAATQVATLMLHLTNPDVNARNAGVASMPVNCLYAVQKELINIYMVGLKAILTNNFADAEWLSEKVIISDILGGISFSPTALASLVLGPSNLALFNAVVNAIMGVAFNVDIVAMIQAIMPGYYTKTANFLGAANYGEGPIFQKYHVTNAIEYHLWFLIYYLFEQNPVSIGGGIFRIYSYDNATFQLQDDFLGCHATNYPGKYVYTNASPASSGKDVTISLDQRITLGSALAFNKNAKAGDLNGATSLLALENALRIEWDAWGTALRDLNDIEEELYTPWYRVWKAANHYTGTWPVPASTSNPDGPRWIYELVSGTPAGRVVGKPAFTANKPAFYFMPELVMDKNHPSLVNGEDLYWTNLYAATTTVSSTQVNYYPSIAAKQSRLTGVNWNEWLNVGYPVYLVDPILWTNDFTPAKTWENNLNDPDALVANAFVKIRNYEQYKFWSAEETQAAYIALAEELAAMIEPLQAKVDALYQAWVDATAARILKEYEIAAIQGEAELCNLAYLSMYHAYHALYENIPEANFTEYTTWFNLYTEAKKDYAYDRANLETFVSKQHIYTTGGAATASGLAFIEDQRVYINAKLVALEDEMATILLMLDSCNKERDAILSIFSK